MLSLSAPSAASIIDTNAASAVLNIIDNDLPAGKIDFSFAGFTVTEGQANAVVTAVRTGGNVGLIYVDYQTFDGTAINGLDYVARSGRLTWNDRDISTRTILIPIIDDSLVESPETFTVSLLGGSQAGVVGTRHPTATVTINDNDFYGSLAFSAPQYFADENGISATIEVVRFNGHAGSVSVNYVTSPGTDAATAAIAGADYSNVSGTLNFGPDETAKTFTIPIIDDTIPDGPRIVRIALSAPVNASLGTNSNVNLTIIDNETVNIPAGGTDTDFVTSDGADGSVNVVAIQHEDATNANRKILIAGDFSLYNHLARSRIARLNNDGSLDRNYAVTTTIDGSVRAVTVQPDGKVVIGGHFAQVDGSSSRFLGRLDVVGKRDTSFQPGAGPDNAVFALAQTYVGDPTNNLFRILAGGDFVNYDSKPRQRIARINPDGTLDPNFDPGSGPNGSVFAIAVQRDQKILIGGDFLTVAGIPRAHIARLNADGSLDASFDPGDGFDDTVHSIVLQADDKILVGGNFKNYNTVSRHGVIRLNMDGSNDTSFDPGTAADGIVNTIVVQPDASILVGGSFQTFDGDTRPNLVRLLNDGSVDLSINFGRGPNSVVDSIAIQSDRGIIIGGDFTEVDGLPRNRVARIYGGSISGSGAIEFAAPVYPVQESAGIATLEVRRTGGLSGTISATYQTSGVTATPGSDYVETNSVVTFQPGETYKTINVQILDDFIPEPDEEVLVSLSNPVGGSIGRQPATTIQIISDDTQISFASDTYVVNENA
ncbi:MAG: Calx-beta domain-containing protein, partial [Limisphaerales bacterium]